MSTLVSWSNEQDANGNITLTEVYESLDGNITPDTAATTWKKSRNNNDGKWTLTQTFLKGGSSGGGGSSGYFEEVWSFDVSTSEEPLESHPSVRDSTNLEAWSKWKQDPNDATNKAWAANVSSRDEPIQQLYAAWKRGQTSYRAPRIVVRQTIMETAPPNMENVGKINFPSKASGHTPSGVNFILTGASSVQAGTFWRNTYEWLGSDKNGWTSYWYN
jgi:hypothetical protein